MTWDLKEGKWIQGHNTMGAAHRVSGTPGTEPAFTALSLEHGQNADDAYPGWMNLFEDPGTRFSDNLNPNQTARDDDHRADQH
jgi:hypothetical protein